MKPGEIKTKIFLDSGDPQDTREVISAMGWLDGQTTNPSLIAFNPKVIERLKAGEKYSRAEINDLYRQVVSEVSALLPDGSVSIEVYADQDTGAEEMIVQAKEMNGWIDNAHIKLPVTAAGLAAAESLLMDGVRVNMTLCFNQAQAAAVGALAADIKKGDVFVSPFIGRLDDKKINGVSLIVNIDRMYREVGSQVEVLAASVRSYDHLRAVLALGVDIATVSKKVLLEWVDDKLKMPAEEYIYESGGGRDLEYEIFDLKRDWREFDLKDELTAAGIEKFAADWNKLIK